MNVSNNETGSDRQEPRTDANPGFACQAAGTRETLNTANRYRCNYRLRRNATPTKPAKINNPDAGSGTAVTRMMAFGATVVSELTP